jgi:hypothetical protein
MVDLLLTQTYVHAQARRVHRALPFIVWDGTRYSVPPECLGQLVEARVPVDRDELTIGWAGNVVARHRLAPSDGLDVWDPAHRAAAETAALGSNRARHLRVVTPTEEPAAPAPVGRIELGAGDFEVAAPDLTLYEGGRR